MQQAVDCPWGLMDGVRVLLGEAADPSFWALCLSDVRWLRNQVVAPLTEELVFRACMLPMLVPCAGPSAAIFTCPLFFGVAHFHHVIEQLRFRQGSVTGIFLSAVFQFSYTAVFGAYTAFVFIRTGEEPLAPLATTLQAPRLDRRPRRSSRSPDRPGALPLLLQLHGLPGRGQRLGAPPPAHHPVLLPAGGAALPPPPLPLHRPLLLRRHHAGVQPQPRPQPPLPLLSTCGWGPGPGPGSVEVRNLVGNSAWNRQP
ncbi:unnamed protein product [Tetraodon nigroviridis]|uniref:CAAX prenyl protease 2 n=1 Tax=Tetraodon nigroviridis TaxID=99883 RepID=Q4SYU8_TETNG|nr:unnamed protein product [Tetraodon nigroviridis]